MEKNDIIGLLEAGVDSAKVGDAAKEFGITFELTSAAEGELRDLGADDQLIALLKRIAPKGTTTTPPKPTPPAPGPAVLMVEVTPGGAEVYVDDEPVGTTSQSGRLRLTQLQPGTHTVRVSHAGYSDLEQSVNLTAGEITNVNASLHSVASPVAPPPVAPSVDSRNPLAGGGGSTNTSGEPGSLGVMVARETPAGGRGAYVTAVAPGSPAEQAGLRPGHTVLAVNGQTINTPQSLLELINRAHAGDYLQIAYNDGSRVQWTRARLAPRSSIVPPPAQNVPPAAGSMVNSGVTPPQNIQPALPTVSYNALHDHGSGGQDYCSGVLTIGGGRILYRGNNTAHTFNIGLDEVKEAKKNGVYLVAFGAFHIRLKSGPNYNFVIVGPGGQRQSPDEVLRVIGMSMGHN
ncbi:MAG: PDZ domain-containing protein [Acidobacteria bacterium]|nr:PDZ domain-containing protein [Acidobacteriota bacterium]